MTSKRTSKRQSSWNTAILAVFLAAPVLLTGSLAFGQTRPFGGELRGITQITGEVVCVGCSLQEAREMRPDASDLYLFRHPEGQVVFKVESFYDAASHARWQSIAGLSQRLAARAPDRVFAELMAEENLFKKMKVTGLLRSNRTLDINQVRVLG